METYRAILAIVLAFLILIGYQYLFVAPEQKQPTVEKTVEAPQQKGAPPALESPAPAPAPVIPAEPPAEFAQPAMLPSQSGRNITVKTASYTAVISEAGGGLKSFKLNNYKESSGPDSELKELISTDSIIDLPLYFSWGVDPGRAQVPLFVADREELRVESGQSQTLTMTTLLSSGLQVTRRMVFDPESYLINVEIDIYNSSETPLQGSPYMSLTNRPFESSSQRYLFSGPAALVDGKLQEVKPDDIEEADKTLKGNITWAAFEGTYFMTGVIPETGRQHPGALCRR